MAKYRHKPTEIEAWPFVDRDTPGVCNHMGWPCRIEPHVHTEHQNQAIALEGGDMIVPEADGEHYYAIKPDTFARNYDEIVEDEGEDEGDEGDGSGDE